MFRRQYFYKMVKCQNLTYNVVLYYLQLNRYTQYPTEFKVSSNCYRNDYTTKKLY